jgi:ATP adenylyltransferase
MPGPATNPSDPAKPTQLQPTQATNAPGFSDAQAAAGPSAPAALHAPWRLRYLESMDEQEKKPGPTLSTAAPSSSGGSFLLDYWNTPAADDQNGVVVRTADGLILLNAFPYASGHLLVALGDPRPTLLDYTPAQRAALWRLVDCAADLITRTLEPQGINIGVNQGRAAGAGVPGHLHVHLVPRWGGDTNFITIVGQVRIIPASLETMAQRYRKAWEQIRRNWI